jgi:Protein of unknown function (DUF4238)
MTRRSRNHHYVPKALQRYFSENRKNLWYSTIGDSGGYLPPEFRNIDSTFMGFDFYTILDEEGKPTDAIEKRFYGAIDDYLGTLLQEIHEGFDRGEIPVFQGEQLESLHHLVLNLASRTPHAGDGNTFDDIEIGRTFANDMISALESQSPDHPDLSRFRTMLGDQRALNLRGKNIRVRGQALPKNQTIDAIKDFVVRWGVSDGNHSFVLQSSVVHRIGNGGLNGLSNPICEWWMPISPKRAIILVRDPQNKLPLVYRIPRDHMREINESSVQSRRELASSSRKLLVSLTSCSGGVA